MDNIKDSETRTLSHTQEQCTHAQLAYIPPSESISIPQDKLVTKAKSCNSSLFHYGKTEEISCQTTSDGTAPDSTRFRNHVLPRKPMEIICSTRVRLQQQRSKYTSLFCQTKRWASQTSQNSIKNKESKSFEIQIAMWNLVPFSFLEKLRITFLIAHDTKLVICPALL